MPSEIPNNTVHRICCLIGVMCIVFTCGTRVMHAQAQWCCRVSVQAGIPTYDGLLIGPDTAHYPYNAYNTYTIYGCSCSSSTPQTVTATGEAAWGQWCSSSGIPYNNDAPITCPGRFGATTSTQTSWSVRVTPYTAGSATAMCVGGKGLINNPYLSVAGCVAGRTVTNTYSAPSCSGLSMNLSNDSSVLAALNQDLESPRETSVGFTTQQYHCSIVDGRSSQLSASRTWICGPYTAALATMTSSRL